jgi:predicted cupin superfamily sugar epimerase
VGVIYASADFGTSAPLSAAHAPSPGCLAATSNTVTGQSMHSLGPAKWGGRVPASVVLIDNWCGDQSIQTAEKWSIVERILQWAFEFLQWAFENPTVGI